ncbi:MAG: hypothetical protein KBC57_08410 [Neisseriaceae bacterium]|nr:hypothetical protein [Neisseriaceae bacterium]MBP6862366.1 hypothetical protein [Neisseriaceae bacterium]
MKTITMMLLSMGLAASVQAASIKVKTSAGAVSVPSGYTLLAEAAGDLTRDGQAELVLVWDTGEEGELGTAREVRIYRQEQQQWRLWHKSQGAVLSSQHGGMMGDPFVGIEIKNHTLVIDHFGGSRHKWSYTHRYRWQQDDWYLIGATIGFGAVCDKQSLYDYNLSTGAMKVRITEDDCEDEGAGQDQRYAYRLARKALPKMAGFYPGEHKLVLPNKALVVYY